MCDIFGCGEHDDMPPIELTDKARRQFLAGSASLPLAAILFYPELARAQAAKLEPISIDTKDGNTATGFIAMPAKLPAPAVVLIHEWWGLNDQIKVVARELADLGYVAVAIDLHGGKVATTPKDARALTGAVDPVKANDQLASMIEHLRRHKDVNGKVGTIGWCFGGGWSLNASLAAPVDATVIYYGRVNKPAPQLSRLKGPVLGHFGTEDKFINKKMVDGFEAQMKIAGKTEQLSVHWYTANHAFANPSSSRYDSEDAATAWERTTKFFAENLKG